MSEEQKFTCGALRSPYNPKMLIAEKIYPKTKNLNLPTTLSYIEDMLPTRNQWNQGTCVAQSCAAIKEWQERKQVGFNDYMSPQFIYNHRAGYPSAGMWGSDAMEILTKYGCCSESIYAYGTIEPKENIKQEAYDEAAKYKIQSFAQVTTIDGLKTALYKNGPCYIALPCYSHDPEWWKPIKDGDPCVGHGNCVVGYTTEGFLLRNSWGSGFNANSQYPGYSLLKYEDFDLIWEAFTCIDDQSPIPDKTTITCKCNIL